MKILQNFLLPKYLIKKDIVGLQKNEAKSGTTKTFILAKVLANFSNSPLSTNPDQSTNYIALAYRRAIYLVIGNSCFFTRYYFNLLF